MGNSISSMWRPKKPFFQQIDVFGDLPEPDEISMIQPTLSIFIEKDSDPALIIEHDQAPEKAISLVRNYLDSLSLSQKKIRLVVLTHGFRSNDQSDWLNDAKDAILDAGYLIDQNYHQIVGILGWGGGADIGLLNYPKAAANCLETGKWLGIILQKFHNEYPQSKIYCIGHSLGAHLMGMAGKCSGNSVDRITGLDPAGPAFQNANLDKRLGCDSAKLVDVIHTDGQDVPYFGTLVPLGHIDFYPNYGWDQPSNDGESNMKPMVSQDENNKKNAIPSKYGGFISESHGRAIDFFVWSIINPERFRTFLKLENDPQVEQGVHRIRTVSPIDFVEVEMGYHLDEFIEKFVKKNSSTNQRDDLARIDWNRFYGNYYVHTNGQPPWC
ncbi:Pancreatic lipase-related protein 3 [Sarcoptes scabiei]|uniref:Pancreatic lipase-like protein 2 n=1 Tax=Sarcoptes scabiei TaxID=52283 RepID=A0A132A9A2_SARSC|nr:Pancreatic lipase-related protein 3 [Sarcoptes scabiei]KPM07543.1 pancreatic lipase-like protein 2 [Sarcoptes scabiei]UXI17673.1 ethylmalonyl-CoA decarboxylase [Sarcoptes scabiei]